MKQNLQPLKDLIEQSIGNGFTVSVHNYFMPTVYNEPVNIMVDQSNDMYEIVSALNPDRFGPVRLIEIFNGDNKVMTIEIDLMEYDAVSGRGFAMSVDNQWPSLELQ